MSNEPKLLRRFLRVAVAEGISFLVLLFIAMPIKYGLGNEWPVKIVGWAHGVLFVAYVYYVARCWQTFRWSTVFTAAALLASLIPFGPFILHRRLPDPAPKKAAAEIA